MTCSVSLILSLVSLLFSRGLSFPDLLHLVAEMHHAPPHQRYRSNIYGPGFEITTT